MLVMVMTTDIEEEKLNIGDVKLKKKKKKPPLRL